MINKHINRNAKSFDSASACWGFGTDYLDIIHRMKIAITFIVFTLLLGCSTRYTLNEIDHVEAENAFDIEKHEKKCFSYSHKYKLKELETCQKNTQDTQIKLYKKYIVTDASPGMIVFLGTVPVESYYFYKAEVLQKDKSTYSIYFSITESWGSINTAKNILSTSKTLNELEADLLNEIQNRINSAHNKDVKERPSG